MKNGAQKENAPKVASPKNGSQEAIKEKKVHPFLFLSVLAFVLAALFHFWNDWLEKSEARRLTEIVQSQEIAELISGEGYNKKAFSKELESLKQAYTQKKVDKDMQAFLQEFANIPDFHDDDVGLAMQGVSASYGKEGKEEWAVFAKWATMHQQSSVVQMEDPLMWHRTGNNSVLFSPATVQNDMFLKDVANKVVIVAKRGLIYNENSKVLLHENVKATQEANIVSGPYLNYDSVEQLAVFPEKADFAGEAIAGKAEVLSWDMQKNKIYGKGNVYVEWTPSDDNNTKK